MTVYSAQETVGINFYKLQILTGRNITPTPLIDWFTGGLNYQIEHHMFPTLPRHSFPRARPLVQSLCKKHGIEYHSTSFWEGVSEILERLKGVTKVAEKLDIIHS